MKCETCNGLKMDYSNGVFTSDKGWSGLVPCPICKGTGKQPIKCKTCKDHGWIIVGFDEIYHIPNKEPCPDCSGNQPEVMSKSVQKRLAVQKPEEEVLKKDCNNCGYFALCIRRRCHKNGRKRPPCKDWRTEGTKYFYIEYTLFFADDYDESDSTIIEAENKKEAKNKLTKNVKEECALKIEFNTIYETFSDSRS